MQSGAERSLPYDDQAPHGLLTDLISRAFDDFGLSSKSSRTVFWQCKAWNILLIRFIALHPQLPIWALSSLTSDLSKVVFA